MLSLVGQNKTCTFNWKFLLLNPKWYSVCLCILHCVNVQYLSIPTHTQNEHAVFCRYIPIPLDFDCILTTLNNCEQLNTR